MKKNEMAMVWTEESLYANTAEYEEAQGNTAKKMKAERILENAKRKGIFQDILEMIEYQKPTDRQLSFAHKIAEDFGKELPQPDLQHGFQWFSQFIAYGKEMSKNLPPTEKQLKLLEGMSYCPDCPSQEGMVLTRGTASEFIGKYMQDYEVWRLTRASDETIRQLMTAFKKADTPKTYEYCLQFDEETAQKMLGQLKIELEMMKAKSVQAELEDFFRQSFIDEDNEKRKKAEYNK